MYDWMNLKKTTSVRLLIQFVSSSSCYNCGGLDHHAKECGLPPQPKKCHYCQSASHMVAHCPHKSPSATQGRCSLEPPSTSSVQSSSPQRSSHTSQDSSNLSKASSSPTPKAASSQRKKRKKWVALSAHQSFRLPRFIQFLIMRILLDLPYLRPMSKGQVDISGSL